MAITSSTFPIPPSMSSSTSTTFSSSSDRPGQGRESQLAEMRPFEPLFLKVFSEEAEAKKDEVYAGGQTKSIQAYQIVEDARGGILFRISVAPTDPKIEGVKIRYRRLESSQIPELLGTKGEATIEKIRLIVKEWLEAEYTLKSTQVIPEHDTLFDISLISDRYPVHPVKEGEIVNIAEHNIIPLPKGSFSAPIGPLLKRLVGLTPEAQEHAIFIVALLEYAKMEHDGKTEQIFPEDFHSERVYGLRILYYNILDKFPVVGETPRFRLLLGSRNVITRTTIDAGVRKKIDEIVKRNEIRANGEEAKEGKGIETSDNK